MECPMDELCPGLQCYNLYTTSNTDIAEHLRSSSYVNDRMPYKARFFDRSRLKIGRQSLPNRIGSVISKISFDWMKPLTKDVIRINLKADFFKKTQQ